MGRGPVETGEDAGERAGKVGNVVGDNGKAELREPRRIAVGVQNDAIALRRDGLQYALEDGAATDLDQRLVTATHAAREAAGEDEAECLFRHSGNAPA